MSKMKTHLLLLCLLGCTRLLLVPADQDLRQDAAEKQELSALTNDDIEGVSPDINPHGVELEDLNNNSNSTNKTTSSTTSYVTVDMTQTATTSATGNSSTIANRTTSVPAILPTSTVNRTSTRGPATASVLSANTSIHLATSTSAPASVPVASSTFVTASISSVTSTSVTASVTNISVSASVPVATSAPVTASVPVTMSVPNTPTPSSPSSNKAPTHTATTSTTSSTDGTPSTTNTPTTKPTKLNIRLIAGCAAGGAFVVLLVCCVLIAFICVRKRKKGTFRRLRKVITPDRDDDSASEMSDILDCKDTNLLPFPTAEGDDCGECFRSFLDQHLEYQENRQRRMELGSRMQKHWYRVDNGQEKKMLTIAPVSQHCPLKLHKYQKGLNKLLRVLKEHPYVHSIELVEYLPHHELLVMVQPLIEEGSLKDMIYNAGPLTNWSDKYARRSSGLPPEKIARYGRQILEAMKFLYSKGFPTLGHVQSGNIFVVNDVCHLGGYENTLLGYKTRLFRLCKDQLQYFDVILFGHVAFEMAAGYELTHLRPGQAEYKTVDKSVRPILEYIFEEGFPHDINAISAQEFFSGSPSGFDSNQVQLSNSMKKVLDKVHKGKTRVQKRKDGTETLAAKVKTTFHGLTQKLGRGGEDSEGDLKEKPTKSQKKLMPKFGRGGEDSKGDLEKKPAKTQKRLKVKSSKDIRGDDTTPLLDDTD